MCVWEYVANEALDKTTHPLQVRANIDLVCEFKTNQVQSNDYHILVIAYFVYTPIKIFFWKHNFKENGYKMCNYKCLTRFFLGACAIIGNKK